MESVLLCAFLLVTVTSSSLWAHPVEAEDHNSTEILSENLNNINRTAHDLYVIRTVIYEVGVLTDVANDTDASNETHEQVDLTFYDPQHNSSVIDLSNIPVPVQTNVSGEVITGIAPASFGTISLPSRELTENGTHIAGYLPLKAPVFPNVLIKQTSNVSSSDPEQGKRILDDLPSELGI